MSLVDLYLEDKFRTLLSIKVDAAKDHDKNYIKVGLSLSAIFSVVVC